MGFITAVYRLQLGINKHLMWIFNVLLQTIVKTALLNNLVISHEKTVKSEFHCR